MTPFSLALRPRHSLQGIVFRSMLYSATLLSVPLLANAQSSTTTSSTASEQLIDIGGEKFDGAGDKRKPECQISHPLSASDAFYIKWNCEDETASRGELETQMWILRPNAPRYVKVSDYLGFPASLEVTEELLGGPFSEWLPASFILVARDTAGNAAISAPFTITNRDNDVDTCSLSLTTRATQSNGDTTGVPSLSVELLNASTFTQSTNNTTFVVSLFKAEQAEPCEIDAVCTGDGDEENELFYSSSLTVSEDGTASGRINLNPGEFAINVEGSGTVSGSILESLSVSGTTIIDNAVTDVTLSCSQN